MSHSIQTPRAPLLAIPDWLRPSWLLTRRSREAAPTAPSPAAADNATRNAMLAILANGIFATFSIWLHFGALDRYRLGFIFPYYGYIGQALFGTMLGLALVSSNRRAQWLSWLGLGLVASTEVLYALGLPTPPWALIRIPLATMFIAIPLLWFYRRRRR